MKKILSVLLVMTMVLSLGLTFAASAEEYTHPESTVFEDAPAADLEHPFDAAIAAGTTPVEFKLSNPKYNYTYHPDGSATNPTIIKKVTGEGEAAIETVVEAEEFDEEGALVGTYNYYMVFDTITVGETMWVVVDTWEEIASLVRAGVGTQFTDINIVLKKDITPLQQIDAAGWDKNAPASAGNLQYHFKPAAEGVNNIPTQNLAGTDRVVVIDGNGYGWTNFSMFTQKNAEGALINSGKNGLFSGIGKNLTLKNLTVGSKAAPIEFAFLGESGLLTSWVTNNTGIACDNVYLYMKGTGDGNGHMGGLVGNKSNTKIEGEGAYNIQNSMFAFEIVRTNHSKNSTAPLGCQQSALVLKNSDFYSYVVVGAADNAMTAASGNGVWDVENVNIYGYGFSTNNMSGFGGYMGANCNFKNVTNYADLAANGGGSVAGFVGNYGAAQTHVYENCHNKGTIVQMGSTTWSFAGGFEGRAQGTVTMTDCTNTGIVVGKYDTSGFLAESHGTAGAKTFINCSNGTMDEPTVIAGGANLGGFIGSSQTANGSTFTNCVNFAVMIGSDNVGGFTGWTSGPANFTDCVSIVSGSGSNVSGLAAKAYFGQSVANPNEELTPEQDADGDGIKDTAQVPGITANGCTTIVYAEDSNWVAPLVGTYYQNVTVPAAEEGQPAETLVIPWYGLDVANSTENASNIDGEGIDAPMTMDEIEEFFGEDIETDGLDMVAIDYEAAATDEGNFVRVFATSAVLPESYAGFTFSYTYFDENGILTEAPERTYWCAEVYNGLNGLDYSYTNELPAAEEGGEPILETVYPFGEFDACKLVGGYIWALTFENVPAGMVTITINAFADDNTSTTVEIVLQDGNIYVEPPVEDIPGGGDTGAVEIETAA